MTNFNTIKTILSGFIVSLVLYSHAYSEILSGNDCGTTCTWTYDSDTKVLSFKGNGFLQDGGADAGYRKALRDAGYNTQIQNINVGEGFSEVGDYFFYRLGTNSTTKLSLPSTMNKTDHAVLYASGIRNLEILSQNINIGPLGFPNGASDITIVEGANINIYIPPFDNINNVTEFNIHCRGAVSSCTESMSAVITYVENAGKEVNVYSYKGLDNDGNWLEYNEDGSSKIYSDSNHTKLLKTYDLNGNQTGFYKYDGAGNLTAAYKNGVATYKRTSYTPAEAAAAANRGDKNHITFTFK